MSELDRLLMLRATIDSMIVELGGDRPQVRGASRFMTVPDFADWSGFSPRTIREYCELGMPHRGEGRNRRVLVAEAEAWLTTNGPRKARADRKGNAA